jgi:hypothetical protein
VVDLGSVLAGRSRAALVRGSASRPWTSLAGTAPQLSTTSHGVPRSHASPHPARDGHPPTHQPRPACPPGLRPLRLRSDLESAKNRGRQTVGSAELGSQCRRAGPLTANGRTLMANQLHATASTFLPVSPASPGFSHSPRRPRCIWNRGFRAGRETGRGCPTPKSGIRRVYERSTNCPLGRHFSSSAQRATSGRRQGELPHIPVTSLQSSRCAANRGAPAP